MNCWSLLTLSQNKLVPKQPKKNGPSPAYFSFIFSLFKQTIQFVKQINAKNVHPVYGAGILTHDLLIMSRHPLPLDQGSHP